MATPTTLITPRDIDVLQALERSPLTARQLLALSDTFSSPFTTERKLRARMQRLSESGRVRRWRYAIAGRGQPGYYTLTRQGFALLYGSAAPVPSKRAFQEVGIAHQQHTFALAEFIVHTTTAAHLAGIALTNFSRENSVCLSSGEDQVFPDCSFSLQLPDGEFFRFFVELDNRSERIHSTKDTVNWERKISIYETVQDQSMNRFRVLVITTRETERLTRILESARHLRGIPSVHSSME